MNTSFSWIKAYVPDLDVDAQIYTDAMTLTGTKVEGFEVIGGDLDKIVIGQIDKIEKHPDADKLIVCQVNIGTDEDIQIVTGANNVHEQDKVPVVLVNGRVACDHDGNRVEGGVKIKKGKLRGVESSGMMCSIQELGSTCDMYPEACADGIYIFDDSAEVGANAAHVLGLDDICFEYEITSNRVDCFSEIGIAREVAATFNKNLVVPEIKKTGNSENVEDFIQITVENSAHCPRYMARVIKEVKLAPSPIWMQRRLASIGIRPINNIVDITNYVMEEYGQPMHAYDRKYVKGNHIIIKDAQQGQKFTTLDGQERLLQSSVLTINDSEKAIGLAGIMGGLNSMVTDQATEIVLESATFDGTNVRLSSKKIGLRTDASGKFEKGLDPNTAQIAMDRACDLIEELGAGVVVGGCIDVYPDVRTGNRVKFEPDQINGLLGTSIDEKTMINYLTKIDLVYDAKKQEIVVPSWRQDIHNMNDLAEEVARFYGYDKIPSTLPSSSMAGSRTVKSTIEGIARSVARFNGFSQAMCYSFESPKVFDKLLVDSDSKLREAITISNPLGEDYSIMRTISLDGMLSSLATNFNRRNKNVRLFELGNVYLPKSLPLEELPDEQMELTLGMYGEGDFFELKGVVENIVSECGIMQQVKCIPSEGRTYLHPGKSAELFIDGEEIGYLGELHPRVVSNYNMKGQVFVAVIHIQNLVDLSDFNYKYEGIVNFPAVNRDLSMLVPKQVLAGDVESIIEDAAGKYLERIELFDVYEGNQVTAGYKSMAYSISFRAKDRTLEEIDITKSMNKIIEALRKNSIELRQ